MLSVKLFQKVVPRLTVSMEDPNLKLNGSSLTKIDCSMILVLKAEESDPDSL